MTDSSIDLRFARIGTSLCFGALTLLLWLCPILANSQSGELDPNLIIPTDATLDRINYAAASRGTTIRYEGTGESASVSPNTLIDGLPGDQTQYVGLSAASNQSLVLDFGALRTIDLVQLSLYNVDARHSRYRVEGSGDGVTYAVLADRSIGEHRERQRLTFPPATIRYLRIKALGGLPYPFLTLVHEILAVGSAPTTPPSEVEIELNPSHAGQSFVVGRKLNLPAGIYEVSYLSGATSAFASDAENSGKTWQAGYQASVLPDASNYTYGSIHPELSLSSSALGAENLLRNDGSYGGRITVRVPVRGDIAFWIRSATPILRGSIRLRVRQVSGSNDTLKERVRDAMVRSVLQEQVSLANWSSWIKDRSCFSCHVVSQGIVGLRESRRKISSLPVSHSLERASLAALLAWQHVTGETAQVPNAPGGYPRSQTAYWVWALSKLASNESAESVFQLSRGLNWLLLSENPTGGWNADHAEGSAAHLHGDGFPSLTHTSEILDSQVSLIEYLRSVPFVSHPTATVSSSGVTLGSNITGMLDVGFARKTNVTGIKLVISDSFEAVNGNFVLTEFEAFDGAQKRTFASALSNASQSGFPVSSAIDGNLAPVLLNGWAYAPNSVRTTPAQALFVLPQPTSVERVRIWQRYGTHELKKFQLFFTTDPTPNLSSTFQSLNIVNVGLDSSLQTLYLASLQRTVDLLTSPTWAYQRNIRTAAYSLMALERSRPYAAPSSDARIQARIAEIVAFLRSTQTPSGGWGDSGQITAAPDSFITALALKALLDASNRTIDSSILSATSLLLNSQGASGMWRAPQLLTELAPTTWVQIALPTLFELLVNSSAEGGRIVEDLLAQGQEDASRLVWTPVPRATGYSIYRKIPGGLYSPIVVNYQTSDGSFLDIAVEPGTTYVYLVKWKDGVGTESDASNEASATPFAAECGTVTRAPAIVSPPLARATEGELYQYAVQAKDDDQGDELRFALPEAPTGMSIDTLTGVIRWTPTPAARGAAQVTVVATDLLGHVALQRYRIIVAERFTNSAPYITSSPLTRATAQHRYLYRVAAFDKDPQDSLIYQLEQGPQGMAFEGAAPNEKTSKSPNLLWTPAATALGDHLVRIRVLDKSGLTATQSFTITVRANAPPQFLTTPQAQIGTLSLFHYIPTVLDPDSDALSFSLVSAPVGMTVGATDGVVRWLTPGTPLSVVGVSLRAADPFGGVAEQPLHFIVTDNQPPVIRSSPVDEAGIGVPYEYVVDAIDPEGGPLGFGLIQGPPGMQLSASGKLTWVPIATQQGVHNIELLVADSVGLVAKQTYLLTVRVGGSGPMVRNPSVPPGTVLTDPTIIQSILNPQGTGPMSCVSKFIRIGDSDGPVVATLTHPSGALADALIAEIDPRRFTNDSYELVVNCTRGPRSITEKIPYDINQGYKPGRFSLALQDLSVPVGRLSIQVERVYDSFDQTVGDFGKGWRLKLPGSVRDSARETPGVESYNSFSRVNVTLADGRRVGFSFRPEGVGGLFGFFFLPRFVPDPGVLEELRSDETALLQTGGDFTQFGSPYNPQRFTLTTQDKTRYVLDEVDGLLEIHDLASNYLKISRDAFEHSNGLRVQILRDDLGRISQITDLNGGVILYEYDVAGHLAAVTNQRGERYRYRYNAAGLLIEILDNRSVAILRNTFNAEGRLVSQTDGSGSAIAIAYDLNSNEELVTDRSGKRWRVTYDDAGNLVRRVDPLGNVSLFSFNQNQQLLSTTNPLGQTTSYTYDSRGNRLSETGPLGDRTTYTYNAFNQVISVTNPRGGVTTYEYDGSGNLIRAIDPFGNASTFTVNSIGLRTAETDALGNRTTLEYDASYRLTRAVDALGNDVLAQYDGNGNLTSVRRNRTIRSSGTVELTRVYDQLNRVVAATDGNGATVRLEYNDRGELIAAVDARGNRELFAYDLSGRRTQTTRADGSVERWTYDGEGRVLESIDARGGVTRNLYDDAGRAIETVRPDGSSTRMSYDSAGRLISRTDGRGNITRFEHDAEGRVVREIDPFGNVSTTAYDAAGNVVSTTDQRGNVTAFVFDANDQLIKTTQPDGTFTSDVYDALGRRTQSIDQAGNIRRTTYDAVGQAIEERDPTGAVTRTTYDSIGNRVATEDALGNTTLFDYDNASRLIRTIDPAGGVFTTTYDAAGNRTSTTDQNGRTTTYTYDALNRLLTETDPRGATSHSTFDLLGNRTSLTDPLGNRSEWSYDSLSRVISERDPLGRTMSYSYDANGNKTSETRRTGKRFEFAFDALDRVTAERWLSGTTLLNTIQTSYDARGNVLSESDAFSRYAHTYDAQDRVTSTDNLNSPGLPRLRLTYSYNTRGDMVSVSDGAVTVESDYDSRANLSARRWTGNAQPGTPLNMRFTFGYDADGRRTQLQRFTSPSLNTVVGSSTWSYDPRGLISNITHKNRLSAPTVWHDYTRNAAGEITTRRLNGGFQENYTYDGAGQLTGTGTETFAYDLNGNRTSTTTGPGNRALSDASYNYTYDEEGNLTEKLERSTNELSRYTYDHRNRLTAFERRSSAGTVLATATYTYDVKDRRIKKTANGTTTTFLHNHDDVWADYDGAGNITARYVYGERIDELLARYRTSDGLQCYLPDHLGSITHMSDLDGNPSVWNRFRAFGELIEQLPTPAAADRFQFTAREYDQESGLYYYRARYFDPKLGRFINEDPIRFEAGDLNLYRYVENRPGSATDPSGRTALIDATVLQKAVIATTGALLAIRAIQLANETHGMSVESRSSLAGVGGSSSLVFGHLGNTLDAVLSPEAESEQTLGHLQLDFSKARAISQTAVEVEKRRSCLQQKGTVIYRVFGERARVYGVFWTDVDPRTLSSRITVTRRNGTTVSMSKFRYRAGLPDSNSGTGLIVGCLRPSIPVHVGIARPINEYPGSGGLRNEYRFSFPNYYFVEPIWVGQLNPNL